MNSPDFTSSVTSEDYMTTCPICLEQMNIPKYLPCLHSFCVICIEAYAANAISDSNSKQKSVVNQSTPESLNIECPVCRSEISVSKEVQLWSENLPYNFLIVELIERSKLEKPSK